MSETKKQIYNEIIQIKKKLDALGQNTSLLVLRNIREARKDMMTKFRDELREELKLIETKN